MYSTDMKTWKKATDATQLFDDNALWEPGHTEVVYMKLVNNGNLALKYKVAITGINSSAKLNEAIEWTIGDVAMGAEQHLAAVRSMSSPSRVICRSLPAMST